jgi:hypothetical protein
MIPWYTKKKKKPTDGKPKVTKRVKLEDKDKTELIKVLDKYFSLYIRLRDTMPNGYCRCISCGQIKPFEQMDCGHYFSRRHLSTRFDERNCHAECRACNRVDAEHLDGYRDNLIRKIGENEYNKIKILRSSTKNWLREELLAMIKHYKSEASRLSSLKGIKINL